MSDAKPTELLTSVTITIHWADQGGLSLMVGDRLIKAVETEEQLSSFMGGFLKALRGQARHITIPIEDHNKLLEYRDQVRRMARPSASTKGMAARLSPSPELSVDEPTESIDDDETIEPLSKWRQKLGFGGRQ
jgi:hypothetical protein